MQVLVIGNGGREHAMVWKLLQSNEVEHVFVAPGNGGTALEPRTTNVAIKPTDVDALVQFAKEQAIDLTIVGPEVPLVAGVVDAFDANGLAIFGPTQAGAQLEGSKSFCKDFLQKYHIPTATYQTFTRPQEAINYLSTQKMPIVIKADGLAAGKGVIIAQTLEEANQTVRDMLEHNRFGDAGARVVIEEFLTGEEASFMVMVDGEHVLPLATSQDHKARDEGDQGPNTGGMGAYSPAPIVTPELHDTVMQEIIYPTIKGLQQEGIRYKGFLYAGLMISTDGEPKVLEFNCRMGDPETQPILMRLQSDFAALCMAGATGQLENYPIEWDARFALGVVMAAGGYPNSYRTGDTITGLNKIHEDVKVFHAGTVLDNDAVKTMGGRVLCVTTLSKTITGAQQKTYHEVKKIDWPDVLYRTDIGFKAVMREMHG